MNHTVGIQSGDSYGAAGALTGAAGNGQSIVIRKIQVDPVVYVPVADSAESFGMGASVFHIKSFAFIPYYQKNIVSVPFAGDMDLHDGSVIVGAVQDGIFCQRLEDQLWQQIAGQFFFDLITDMKASGIPDGLNGKIMPQMPSDTILS